MTKQLAVNEILDCQLCIDDGVGTINIDMEWFKQSLKALVTEMVNEIIGEGEAHVSHVCPQDSIPCREFAARGQLRHEQRQRAKAEIERRFL